MGNIPQPGEVWYAWLPKEEDKSAIMERPCIIVEQYGEDFLVIKLTRHIPRQKDPFDTEITDWQHCGLKNKSTARVSKMQLIPQTQIDNYKGKLSEQDEKRISEALEKFLT